MSRIFLIGPMGSGKSTVGKSLARKLQFEFFDSDREIEARCGVDIPTIFEFEGETGFRKREKKVLDELTQIKNVVVATGGGAILNRSNRKILRERGHVILLSVDIEEQIRRVSLNRNRPLLQVGDVEAKLRTLMDERRSLYESTAHHAVSTDSSRMQNVVARITRHLERNGIAEVAAKATPRATSKTTTKAAATRKKAPSKRPSGKAEQSDPAKKKNQSGQSRAKASATSASSTSKSRSGNTRRKRNNSSASAKTTSHSKKS